MNEFSQAIQTIAVYAIPVLFAISLHEAAHGYVARYFGDPTAHEQGRLSVNPTRHIDPFGTIILPLILYLTIHMPFGYAKPVPVDYSRLRNPKKQMGFVAAAGPMANFAMGLAWMIWLELMTGMGVSEPFLVKMAVAGVNVNAIMCVFNLLPVPPLDGGRIMTALLPNELARRYARIELYTPWIFIGLLVAMYFNLLTPLLTSMVGIFIGVLGLLVLPLQLLLGL
ncbi:site-2 protease family protein [Pseudoduganella sp. SL102]|uniref:Peptidase M50 n=1 Tax=Pseudoduganella albidiflava TaxID=321983 RepID=A0A411WUH5_9BURK|nr:MULTISPECIES: site-2 protease family protein [Pseudoduganella]QBI00298.1 site-2 protease family protein [Pseudoduganella albidiflava]WBS01658.1 site-2 protease family protein [Pseudoduganella sp. SL102]GGY52749.1 peptidase M50 [Pseudoduganella albidiflava]